MNENCNYAHRMEELMMLQDAERPLLSLILLESPKRSRFWEEKAVKELISMENMILVDCDAGAFGGKDLDGYDIIKTYGFLTNSQDIAGRVNKRTTGMPTPRLQERHLLAGLPGQVGRRDYEGASGRGTEESTYSTPTRRRAP